MMPIDDALITQVKEKIEAYESITILTHLNPDPDTLGTGLGIYVLLKAHTSKHVEIVNASESLPRHLDFLPFYQYQTQDGF